MLQQTGFRAMLGCLPAQPVRQRGLRATPRL